MKTRRYAIGPFRFTFANGRLWASYSARHYGDRLTVKVAPTAADMSIPMRLAWFFENPRTGKPYLTEFVRWYFPDLPEIQERAAQLENIANAMPSFDYSVNK